MFHTGFYKTPVLSMTTSLHSCSASQFRSLYSSFVVVPNSQKTGTGFLSKGPFVKRSESEHDVWEAGHSSISLSAALGMAIARDFKGEKNQVIAIIGDGALTGGMAFEALNHIGHEKES
jgi:hypothetical protein